MSIFIDIVPPQMPTSLEATSGQKQVSIALKNHVITTYPINLENIFIICLQLQHICLHVYAETTLLNITDHHLRYQPA